MTNPTWVVPFQVYGPVTLRQRYRTQERKGYNLDIPIYSDIVLESLHNGGFRATVSAVAKDEILARKVAALFFGRMLDVLCLRIDSPLLLSISGNRPEHMRGFSVQRVISPEEISLSFQDAGQLFMESPTFLRALSWYRKGVNTEDPFDCFFALWNAIEIVGSKFCPSDNEYTQKGTKNQIYECFQTLWGIPSLWPSPADEPNWISLQHDLRSNIAHGTVPVNIESVSSVLARIEGVTIVAHRFLCDWWNTQLHVHPLNTLTPNKS